ncbi:MAG: ribosome biogenesis factor YjgA [bacterium]
MSDDINKNDNSSANAQPGEEQLSKTARKREAQRMLELGRRLGQLNAEQFAWLNLPAQLAHAIEEYQRFSSHGAKKRQLQFVGKLMRKADTAAIEAQLADLDGQSAEARYQFNQLEHWREALLAEPDSLTAFIATYPQVDRQQLRQLVKKVQSARNEPDQKAASRRLFRFLRETSETSG